MVNPIGANAGTTQYVPAATDLLRPESIPEPAVTVTAPNKALNTGSSSTASKQRKDDTNDISNPIDQALEQVNNSMEAWATGMRFEINPEAKRVVVSIIDSATGEVLRTVPSDAVLRVAKMIVQLQGKMIDTKV
ncbi:flagellar protein FlaG [Alcaligenaceae bacterium]|nr:flagellar protein FlaG [Alcaligenaceae bacterium]